MTQTPSRLGRELARGMRYLERQARSSFDWAGQTYPCVAGPEYGGKILGSGGYRITADETLFIRLAVLGGVDPPTEKQLITFRTDAYSQSKTVRIDNVTLIGNAILVCQCSAQHQGA